MPVVTFPEVKALLHSERGANHNLDLTEAWEWRNDANLTLEIQLGSRVFGFLDPLPAAAFNAAEPPPLSYNSSAGYSVPMRALMKGHTHQ